MYRKSWQQRTGRVHQRPAPFGGMSQPGDNIMDVLRILIAILLPPLGVFLQVGIGLHFWINIVLTLLGYIPGIVHAVWVIVSENPK